MGICLFVKALDVQSTENTGNYVENFLPDIQYIRNVKTCTLLSLMVLFGLYATANKLPGDEFVHVLGEGFEHVSLKQRYLWSSRLDTMTVNQALGYPQYFEAINQERLHLGNFNDVGWIKIHLTNHSSEEQFLLEFDETYLDTLRMFVVQSNEVMKEYAPLGLQFPSNRTREYLSINPSYLFPIHISKGDTISIFMHCTINKGTLQVGHELWTVEAYDIRKKEIRSQTTYLFLLIGFSSLVTLIALVFFIFTKDTLQLYYAGFIIANVGNIVLMADFFSAKTFEKYFLFGINYTDAFGLAQVFFGLQYVIHFLHVKEKAPIMYKVMRVFVWAAVINALLTLFLHQVEWVEVLVFNLLTLELLFAMLACMVVAVYLSSKGDLMARYFVVAYLPLLYFVGHYFALIWELTNKERTLSWESFIFFEIFVLTLAMAHRYYLIGKKNIEYQKTINRQQKDQIRHIITAQEKERGRIAKELHDGVVQEIGSVILGIRHNQDKEGLLHALENSSRDLRTLSHRMMPKTLHELGLVAASRQMMMTALQYAKIEHTFESFNFDQRPSEIIEITLYRILQELVNNLIKHSQASFVSIQYFVIDDSIMLVFSDDGIGMDSDTVNEGMGLRNIHSRLEMVSGSVSVEPNEPQGTTFTIRVPFVPLKEPIDA